MASDRRNLFWTLVHIGLGFFCTLTPFALISWFYLILISNLGKSLNLLSQKKPAFFLMLFSYLISFEVLDRMSKTSPYIPYELGKYLLVFMAFLGIIKLGIKSQKGLFMAFLVTPALFYDYSGQRLFIEALNYFIAPFAVGLGIAFANCLIITDKQLNEIIKLIWLTCLSCLVFTYIKTPDFDNIQFTLGAIKETTAGHSSNQVSTILGLGMFLSFYSFIKGLNFSGKRLFDVIILISFAFQGLLSFSRGGMMVGALGVLLLVIFLPDLKKKGTFFGTGNRFALMGVLIFITLYGVFELANSATEGKLLLRYKGETQGTFNGSKEITADHFVTGRLGIFEKDIKLWENYFISGVGCGVSKYMRDEGNSVAAHVELSRLLADHGLLGLVYSWLFFSAPYFAYKVNKNSTYRILLVTFLTIAILTTFHAAMRTYVTPLFMILGVLKIKE
jgi:hypothetical protein